MFLCESLATVFPDLSTKELHHGEEGKEKESEEEKVISSFGVSGRRHVATYEFGGWTHPAAFCLCNTHFER
jgi:hypothetical protein